MRGLSRRARRPRDGATAAPGVAFAYHDGFRMPDATISAAQEAHAGACEKLGLTKCRITGMTYELDDRDRVDGTLEIAIDPLLARGFGRDAIAVVEKQEGKLRYARITGEDQNPVLDEAARREGNANRTIAQLEADLARTKDENERVQLREQIRQLRADIQAAQSASAESEARIQRTPMTFTYRGGAASRGFSGRESRDRSLVYVHRQRRDAGQLCSQVLGGCHSLARTPPADCLGLEVTAIRPRKARMGEAGLTSGPEE